MVSGRGEGQIYNYTIHNFKNGPKPVIVVSFPRSKTGGNFVPADNPLETGEAIEISYSMALPEADGNTLYFTARGLYLQTALYVPTQRTPPSPGWVRGKPPRRSWGPRGLNKAKRFCRSGSIRSPFSLTHPRPLLVTSLRPIFFLPSSW